MYTSMDASMYVVHVVCERCVFGGGGGPFIAAFDRDIVIEAHVPVCVWGGGGGGGGTFIAAFDRDIVIEAHVPANERDVKVAALAHPLIRV
jgi:hypothetical protein